jgi:hypothetical protein
MSEKTKVKKQRNGADLLGNVMMGTAVAFMAAAMLFVIFRVYVPGYVFYAAAAVLMIWEIFRACSTGLSAREKEDASFRFFLKRIKQFPKYRYRRCPECDSWLRMPAKRGTHKLDCPKCHYEVKVHIL